MLNLTLQPVALEFSVIPYEIDLRVGDKEAEFQISVPQDIEAKVYTLSFDIMNDQIPAIYTPVKDTKVVISGFDSILINIYDPLPLPYTGITLKIPIVL